MKRMRSWWWLLGALVVLVALAFPARGFAQAWNCERTVTGGTYRLNDGEVLDGNLCVFGGMAVLNDGAQVNGDVTLIGGTLRVEGEVDGDIIATGGLVDLDDTAVVRGDIHVFAAQLNRSPDAIVSGNVDSNIQSPLPFTIPSGGTQVEVPANPFLNMLWFFFKLFLWAAAAVVIVLFFPRQTGQVAATVISQPLISVGLGLLTAFLIPVLMVLIAITIIGIPVSLLIGLVLGVAWAFGVIALGAEAGKRMARMFNQEWALPVQAAIGTFVLVLVANGINEIIPCIGWMAPFTVGVIGLGAVLLTLFGTRPYPPAEPGGMIVPPSAAAAPNPRLDVSAAGGPAEGEPGSDSSQGPVEP